MCARAVRCLSVRIWPATKRVCLLLIVEAAFFPPSEEHNQKTNVPESSGLQLFFFFFAGFIKIRSDVCSGESHLYVIVLP